MSGLSTLLIGSTAGVRVLVLGEVRSAGGGLVRGGGGGVSGGNVLGGKLVLGRGLVRGGGVVQLGGLVLGAGVRLLCPSYTQHPLLTAC